MTPKTQTLSQGAHHLVIAIIGHRWEQKITQFFKVSFQQSYACVWKADESETGAGPRKGLLEKARERNVLMRKEEVLPPLRVARATAALLQLLTLGEACFFFPWASVSLCVNTGG